MIEIIEDTNISLAKFDGILTLENEMSQNPFFKTTLLVFTAIACFTINIIAQNTIPPYGKNYQITESRKMAFQSGENKHNLQKNTRDLQRPLSVLDSCTTNLYRLILGAPGLSEKVNDVTVLQNDEVLLAGSIELTATNKDGLIAKISNTGIVLWYRHYGNNGYNEWINKIKQTSDGGSIAIGTSEDNTTLERRILILKLSADGLVEWSNMISVTQNFLWTEGIDVIETTGKSYAFTGDNKFSVIYGRLARNGAITWNKSVKLGDEQYALSIMEDYNGWFIGTTGKDSGYSVMNVFKVDSSDGNLIWNDKLGGPSQFRHYIAHGVEIANLRPRITGIYRDDNSAPWRLFRGTVNTSGDMEPIETYTLGVPIDSTAFTALTPWTEEIGFSNTAGSSDIYMFKDVVDAPVRWRYHYDDIHPKKLSALERTLDGGFLMVGNQIENNTAATDIFVYKADSAGLMPSCPGTAFSVTSVKNEMAQPYAKAFNENVVNNLSVLTIPINSDLLKVDSLYTCKEIYCPQSVPADTCLQTFNKTYRSSSFCDLIYNLSETKDHSLLAAGVMRDDPTDPTTERGTLTKFDKSGNILIKKKAALYRTYYTDLFRMMDSAYLVPSLQNGKLLLTKIDLQLNEIWSTSYQLGDTKFGYDGVVQTSDSSIYMIVEYDHPYPPFLMLLKFTKNGTLVWQKNYAANNAFAGFHHGKMLVMNDNIYFCTKTGDNDIYPAQVIIRFDKDNGNITWMKNLSNKDYILNSNDVFVGSGNKLIIGGNVSSASPGTLSKAIIVRLDENGTIEKTKVFSSPLEMDRFNSVSIKFGGDILLGSTEIDYSTNPYTFYECLISLDADFNIKSSIKYQVPPSSAGSLVTETFDKSILEIGWNYYAEVYNNDFYIRRYSPDGKLGTCPDLPLILKDSLFTLHPTTITMNTSRDFVITPGNEFFQTISYDLNLNNTSCGSASNCNSIKLGGSQNICNIRDTVAFSTVRNTGCNSPVFFSFDSSFGKIVSQTDSSIKIKFNKQGKLFLTAEITAGCEIKKDSLELTINVSRDSLSLGPDLQLCGSTTYTLNAASGYRKYRWNDNSTDSLFTVSSPGLYYVTVEDLCGKTFSDSVKVSLAPPVPLSAGADTFKCNKDSITLVATPGFTSYSWTPDHHITNTKSQTVTIYPTTTTTWHLVAEKNPGCISRDTITITVYNTPPIFLGADTSICMSKPVILNGGNGFNSWQWNNGDTTQLRSLEKQGTYSVKAYDKNGCFSTDTLKILTVFSSPALNLNKDNLLCQGTVRTLDAGAGFAAYLWNNNSRGRSLEIHDIGKYWVTVTDHNSCSSSDTTEIKTIAALPTDFTPKDTTICTYQSIFLKSLFSFNTYLWSTGSNAKGIEVTTPGTYWLQVTDSNRCLAKAFIEVTTKKCPEAIFFPTAFSPNNNNLNDSYRPTIFGAPTNYRFTIFNRYGEKIFESNDPSKSWNGKVKGIDQNSGAFIWICTFQFSNGVLKTEKGSFILIR
ncbi:MAG: hypothetical protein JWP81_3299 [Ferruginibacter sp.]|nr:hypothetical protein [Ferruginibacter sp.]